MNGRRSPYGKYMSAKQHAAMQKLYANRVEERMRGHLKKRLLLALSVFFLISLFALVIAWKDLHQKELLQGRFIRRNEAEGNRKRIAVTAISTQGQEKEINLIVDSRQYSIEEVSAMLPKFYEALERTILSENESPDRVNRNLLLVTSLPGYPFRIRWKSERPLLLNGSGQIDEVRLLRALDEGMTDGIEVCLTAQIEYGDFAEERQMAVRLIRREQNAEEAFWAQMEHARQVLDEATAQETYLELPETVDGTQIRYQESAKATAPLIFLGGIPIALLLFYRDDQRLLQKAEEREEQLRQDYPRLLHRFALYCSAGLTVKNAWQKICAEYAERKGVTGNRYVYEEMRKAETAMQDGVGEEDAYDAFAQGCGTYNYRVFAGILITAVQTGSGQLKRLLSEELKEAHEARKKNARILGEQAGTKLLLPMFLMLLLVLVMILVPACISFSS